MKKTITILAIILMIFSCAKDECEEQAQIQYLESSSGIIEGNTRDTQTLIINEDTCIEGDYNVEPATLRINGSNAFTVDGDLNVEGFILFAGEGTLKVTGSLIATNIFFLDTGGNVEVGGGILISGDANSTGGTPFIRYCNFFQNQGVSSNIVVTQDCVEVDISNCDTLSDGGLSTSLGDTVNVPCGFDYAGQSIKVDKNGRSYIYIRQNN